MKKFIFFFLILGSLQAQIRLPKLISDGMILQRDAPLILWGWASPGESIALTLAGKTYKTKTSTQGDWKIQIPAHAADGKAHKISIKGKNQIILKDVYFGDVWLCSGQSNMVHQLDIHDVTYAQDIEEANFPLIRQFLVPTIGRLQGPAKDLTGGSWQKAIGENVRPFSAVAYFFAREIHLKYGIPVGIINSSYGGTPIEAWTSEEGLKDFPDFTTTLNKNKDSIYVAETQKAAFTPPRASKDLGMAEKWFSTEYTPKAWRSIQVPGYWEDQGIRNLDGVVWYRKEIQIPAGASLDAPKLWLGRIVDADEVFINGQKIGGFTYQYPQRRYKVPQNLLKPGKNLIVVKVSNFFGKGGFVPDKPHALILGKDTIDLRGEWKYKVGEVFEPQAPRPMGISVQNQPSSLFNSMIHPFVNFSIKGVLWYQGESNAGRPQIYEKQIRALVADWRRHWPEVPFIHAQLPGFMEYTYLPTESNWAQLREASRRTLDIPRTAMTVNIDLGEWNDIHPDNKLDVGRRMALAARKIAYGDKLVYSGPIIQKAQKQGQKIILSFEHIGSALSTADGEEPQEFAVAGSDKKFKWVKATLQGKQILLDISELPEAKYVRYAWADNPVNPNVINSEGLPASPFEIEVN